MRATGTWPRVCPWASASIRCPPLQPVCHTVVRFVTSSQSGHGELVQARVRLRAQPATMWDTGVFPAHSGRWDSPLCLPCNWVRLCAVGASSPLSGKPERSSQTFQEGAETGGNKPRVSPAVRHPLLSAGEGERAASPGQSYPTPEHLLLFSSLAVGLPRYQHHPSPVCDRKDFVLNFNGISSFHPSASGSYYHHHHHQSVCQDIKPCVM